MEAIFHVPARTYLAARPDILDRPGSLDGKAVAAGETPLASGGFEKRSSRRPAMTTC
jgi:hypothetical protein